MNCTDGYTVPCFIVIAINDILNVYPFDEDPVHGKSSSFVPQFNLSMYSIKPLQYKSFTGQKSIVKNPRGHWKCVINLHGEKFHLTGKKR